MEFIEFKKVLQRNFAEMTKEATHLFEVNVDKDELSGWVSGKCFYGRFTEDVGGTWRINHYGWSVSYPANLLRKRRRKRADYSKRNRYAD